MNSQGAAAQHRVSAISRHLCQANPCPSTCAVVIGAGVVGLAVARSLALSGHRVVVLEAEEDIGTSTSSRNSQVVHAGIYYPQGSLKARLCVEGREALYAYCEARGVPYKRIGKLMVAADESQLDDLRGYKEKGHKNGVDLKWLEASEAKAMEPELRCVAALWSENSGIVDCRRLMQSLRKDAEQHGAIVMLNSCVVGGAMSGTKKLLWVRNTKSGEVRDLKADTVINAAGLQAQEVARSLRGLRPEHIPERYLARGCYFKLQGEAPFRHLIYPMPEEGGLGAHLTLDLNNKAMFGPDVEWVDDIDYTVNPERAQRFYHLIRHYWPGLPDGALQPAFSGVRPKVSAQGEKNADFIFQGPEVHGIKGLINLFGIESPGLTSSLAIGRHVAELLKHQ